METNYIITSIEISSLANFLSRNTINTAKLQEEETYAKIRNFAKADKLHTITFFEHLQVKIWIILSK